VLEGGRRRYVLSAPFNQRVFRVRDALASPSLWEDLHEIICQISKVLKRPDIEVCQKSKMFLLQRNVLFEQKQILVPDYHRYLKRYRLDLSQATAAVYGDVKEQGKFSGYKLVDYTPESDIEEGYDGSAL
jgi:hypothetical protein